MDRFSAQSHSGNIIAVTQVSHVVMELRFSGLKRLCYLALIRCFEGDSFVHVSSTTWIEMRHESSRHIIRSLLGRYALLRDD